MYQDKNVLALLLYANKDNKVRESEEFLNYLQTRRQSEDEDIDNNLEAYLEYCLDTADTILESPPHLYHQAV